MAGYQGRRRIVAACLAGAVPASLVAGNMPEGGYVPETGPIPALHVTLREDHASRRRLLRAQQEMCVEQTTLYQEQARRNPDLYQTLERAMREAYPDFSLDRAVQPVKDWSRVAVVRTEEYFDGPRYARYRYWKTYRIAEDGTCRLLERKRAAAEIDDGRTRYFVDFTARKAQAVPGPGPAADAARARLGASAQTMPGTWRHLSRHLIAAPRNLARRLRDGFEMQGRELVVPREWCDRITFKGDRSAMVCLWSRARVYPGPVERPVVLWWQRRVGPDTDTGKAVAVRRLARIPDAMFKIPPDVVIVPRRKRGNSPGNPVKGAAP